MILNANNINRWIFFSALSLFLLCSGYSVSQPVKRDSVYRTPFDTNKIRNAYMLDIKSDTIGVKDFIWSDRRNLSEIMNEKAGYFIHYLGIGGRNPINFNNFDSRQIGIFKDGVQINDNYFGGFDEENISVSEIQKVEEVSNISSFLYGFNSTGKSLNIITKDALQPTIFSQLRYSQDRYGALFADFSLNIPFSKKFNFIFGINSHFTDGYYQNSSYNVWRGRFKFNYYVSQKLNIKAAFCHNVTNRGLNDGLKYNTDDTLKSSNFADVYSLGQYERISNYNADITFTGNFLNDNNSLTKMIFYSNNTLRILRNGENGVDTGVYLHNDYHYIQYGIDLSQNLRKIFTNDIETRLMVGGNAYFNYTNNSLAPFFSIPGFSDNIIYAYTNNFYSLKSKLDFILSKLILSGSYRTDYMYDVFHNSFGLEGKYKIENNADYSLMIKGGFNSTNGKSYYTDRDYYEFGFESRYKSLYLDAYQYAFKYVNAGNSSFSPENGNYTIKLLTKYFDFGINANYTSDTLFPKIFLKSDIVYHDFLFKNRLDLRIGISAKYFSEAPIVSTEQQFYGESYTYQNGSFIRKDFFNVDFYIGARIGTANVNLTIANLFDKVNYTTAIYPYDARGGFLNSISRFTIVWDFNR
ncbi:MAG: TonB-dependent receptor plug domain-containing protein [Ignavibacteriae bacterium]|nr:TonB-dependent receptor plug domain-containing protein [Ignavibacteriota bacterium]